MRATVPFASKRSSHKFVSFSCAELARRRAARKGKHIAPPMMTYQLNAPLRSDKPDKRAKGGSYRGIHAFVSGGSWEWFRPVYPGDTLHVDLWDVADGVRFRVRTDADVVVLDRGRATITP